MLKYKGCEIAQKGDTLKRRRREKGQLFYVEQFQGVKMQLKKVSVKDIITAEYQMRFNTATKDIDGLPVQYELI